MDGAPRIVPAANDVLVHAVWVDKQQLREAFDKVLDQAVVFHCFADHMRDYDVFVYATADPRTGIPPEHLRYRFTHCVRATVTTAVRRDVWPRSLGDEFIDYGEWCRAGEPEGYVWGVKWHGLYPGMRLMPDSDESQGWSAQLGVPFHEALIETDAHTITLVFSDLRVSTVETGSVPFTVPSGGPDGKFPLD